MDEIAGERLHKVLARSGVASRRDCEDLIRQGRIKVDGKVVTRMGVRVDPDRQAIMFDETPVKIERPVYILAYKPKGAVCTTKDQFGRPSVVDLVGSRAGARIFPVGRMEEDSEGLIILTNDGTFANRLVKHRTPLRHVYFLRVRGRLTQQGLQQVREGVWLSDGRTGPMYVKVLRWGKKMSTLLVSPSAQQHRIVRRAFAKVGVVADRIVRTRIGPLNSDNMKRGTWRYLSKQEVEALQNPATEDVLPVFRGRGRWSGSAATKPQSGGFSRRRSDGGKKRSGGGGKPRGQQDGRRRGKSGADRRESGAGGANEGPVRRRVVGP